jgi:HEAT repeat protein
VTVSDLPDDLVAAAGNPESESLADRIRDANPDTTKACADRLRSVTADDPSALDTVRPTVEALLTDDDRSVRLTVTKAVARFARAETESATVFAPALVNRLDDDFYFVRGRAAEALGHLALADPDAIETATVIARLLNALSLDREEICQEVTGALARIALGDPKALRTVTDDIADDLGDDDPAVRYYLTTAIVAVATEYPGYCRSVTDTVGTRLSDDDEYVRGRAAEVLGLVATVDSDALTDYRSVLEQQTDDDSFVAERAQFALAVAETGTAEQSGDIGDCAAIAAETADIVDAITTADGEGCPHCGEPGGGAAAPFCPTCGAPLQQ